jgi:hypothetical protein
MLVYVIPIVILVVAVMLLFIFNTEKFGLTVSGDVQKYKRKGAYTYIYNYNLPITNPPFQVVNTSVSFNEPAKQQEYKVYIGHTKDKLAYIGNLSRFQDGFHKFTYRSDVNYHYTCVTLGEDVIDCVAL